MLLVLVSMIAVGGATNGEVSAILQLKLSAPSQILVGEPTRLTVEWSATRAASVVPAEAAVWLDGGDGFQRHQETSLGTASTAYFDQTLKPGEITVSEHVLAVTGYPDVSPFGLTFPHAGRYRVMVQYKGVASNVATINAIEPTGSDAELLKRLRRRPELLSEWGLMPEFGAGILEDLLGEYRESRYLARPRVLFWKKRLKEARTADRQLAAVARLMDEIGREEIEGTPFEEDRLELLAEGATAMGDRPKARAWYETLLVQHPKGAAAAKARRWIADQDAIAREETVVKQQQ